MERASLAGNERRRSDREEKTSTPALLRAGARNNVVASFEKKELEKS